ncbi:MAG: glycosyltransferase N-terminal domain-containing protein [Crocinitomicaceae bacterium]
MFQFGYNLGIRFYSFIVVLASVFNEKAKKRVGGYRVTLEEIKPKKNDFKRIWFHCASLGEFEQGRPLIERYKNDSAWEVYVSFFSPSGFEVIEKKKMLENQFYLMPDTKKNAQKTIDKLNPDLVVFVKYEFWANHVFEIAKRNIPLYCISGLFRENQIYFRYRFFASVLKCFDHFFVQDEKSSKLLAQIDLKQVSVTGDTRFDRVTEGARKAVSIDLVEFFLNGEKAFLVGSSWPDDEKHLFPLLQHPEFNHKTIIAPHEIGKKHLKEIKEILGEKAVFYSHYTKEATSDFQFLIIDNIGMLSNLYQYGELAYIGGAFHGALHNILEPAAFGLPVIFGPNFKKFPEGDRFIEAGIGFSVSDEKQLYAVYKQLIEGDHKSKVLEFVERNVGATDQIYSVLSKRSKDQ